MSSSGVAVATGSDGRGDRIGRSHRRQGVCGDMRNSKRKIVLGIAALTVPLVTVASLGSPAFAKKAPPNPVSCKLAATVNINPPLTVAGEPSAKGQFGVAAVNVTLSSC